VGIFLFSSKPGEGMGQRIGAIYNSTMAKVGEAQKSAITVLRGEGQYPRWLVHGFSTRVGGFSSAYGGGALNLGYTRDDSRAAVERNRSAFLKALGCGRKLNERWPLVTLHQVHSDIISVVSQRPEQILTGDGLITSTPGLLLAVQTADCLPILLADVRRTLVGAVHAGWRGTLARIAEKAIGVMRQRFGSEPEDIRAIVGPGIGACCYEVGSEVREQFESQFTYGSELFHEAIESDVLHERYPLLFMNARAPGHGELGRKLFLDLEAANRRQLVDCGVKESTINTLKLCTACRTDMFFSYRKAKGPTGRQMGIIGIRP
jgi:YfiH family protein